MPQLNFSIIISASQESLWRFHNQIDALTQITPPGTQVRILDPPKVLETGVAFTLVITQPPFYVPLHWRCEFIVHEPPLRFIDRQVPGKGPFTFWEHEHRFEAIDGTHSRLVDTITYTPPLGVLGTLADKLFLRRMLEKMFAYRHRVTKEALETV